MELLTKYGMELIFGLISTGLIAFCKHLHSQNKNFQKLLEIRENEALEKTIDKKIEPIVAQIKELQFQMQEVADKECADMAKIARSWRYRIITLCQIYLEQGFMTNSDYSQLSEMYTLYHELGGNGQVTDFYNRTCQLRIVPDEDHH